MKRQKIWLFIFLSLLKSSLQQTCVNTWEADLGNPNIILCPVATASGEFCAFPFNFNGAEYKTCQINNPGNTEKIPQCFTPSRTWSNCILPTNAVITSVTTRKNGGASTNGVSLNGGTLIWITGRRFAMNTFSFAPTSSTSNQVYLTTATNSYSCEIHPDKVTSTQITCYAPAMLAGKYLVRVFVNGELIPLYQYENDAFVIASDSNTPKINSFLPMSGVPGTLITINGDFKTSCYTRDEDGCSDDSGARISRIYFGGQICNLIDPSTNALYQPISQTSLKCKLEGSEINFFNGSVLVSEQYGRSLTSRNAYLVSPDEKFYNFRTYPEIKSLTPSNGSVEGGTYLTIIGSHFYHDEYLKADIKIAGTDCQVVSYEKNNGNDSKLVCLTSNKPVDSTDHIGGRGITLIRQNTLTTEANIETAQPLASATITVLDKASYTSPSGDVTIWLRGYFIPSKTSNYKFEITGNSYGALFISNDETSQSKSLLFKFGATGSKVGTKNLEGGNKYYIEAVSSRQGGSLSIAINAIMLDTYLTDSVSNLVTNEIQEIEINSTLIPESYVISIPAPGTINTLAEIQEITLNSSSKSPFVLSFDGAHTTPLDFDSNELIIQSALNDLPTLGPNSVTVAIDASTTDTNLKIFTVTFSSSYGDVPLIESGIDYDSLSVVEVQSGIPNGINVQLTIQNQTTPLFNIYDTQANIKKSIDSFFGIRCPLSIISPIGNEAHSKFDFENECTESDKPLEEIAFCGRCSRNGNIIVQNTNSSLSFRHLCFAYKTSQIFYQIDLIVYSGLTAYSASSGLKVIADSKWHYTCVDLHAGLKPEVSKTSGFLNMASITSSVGDVLIDAVTVRRNQPLDYQSPALIDKRRIFPNLQIYPSSLSVIKDRNVSLSINYKTVNCSNDLDIVTIRQDISGIFNISRTSEASPPVKGNFDLSWNDQSLSDIPADITEYSLKSTLESVRNFGRVSVQRSKDCSGYKWRVKWIDGGDKPSLTISNSSLNGINPVIGASNIQDGGAKFYPLLDDILRTHHSKPQVSVLINNIAAKCIDSCGFAWSESATPTVSSINTSNKNLISITGTGFDTTASNNIVKIGQTNCVVQTATATQLTCIPDKGPIGVYNFTVNVLGKGLATMNDATTFEFELIASDFNPKLSGVGGGAIITINGSGFTKQTSVKIDSILCTYVSHSYTAISCIVPSNPTTSNKTVDVVVSELGSEVTLDEKFTYDFSNTPQVSSVNPAVLNVLGGEIINITGTNFPVPLRSITIGSNRVRVISSSSTLIQIVSPSLNPGLYDIVIPTGSLGNALVDTKLEYQFYVSDISPSAGSIRGGTLVTINGAGFSSNCTLNIVSFGIYACDVKSCSETNITCLTRSVHTIHEITNDGYNNVYGFRYAWDTPYLTIKKEEFVSWSWQPPVTVNGLKFKVEETNSPSDTTGTGFKSGEPTEFGSYKYQFMDAGLYYYWSGFVDVNQEISFRGVIEVLDQTVDEKVFAVQVTLNEIQAQKCSFPFTYNEVEYSACTDIDKGFDWCSPTPIYSGQFIRCLNDSVEPDSCSSKKVDIPTCTDTTSPSKGSFKFTHCQSAQITNISPLTVDYDTLLTIEGTGFSSTQCENKVLIGEVECNIVTSSETSITCKLGKNSRLTPNKLYGIELLVDNIGYALPNNFYQIKFISVIDSIEPVEGSTTGGTQVKIKGDGFTKDTLINLGLDIYFSNTADITYNQITLITKPQAQASVNLTVFSNGVQNLCKGQCVYDFKTSLAPVINSVSPLSVNDAAEITIVGQNFVIDSSLINVIIGKQDCQVSTASSTEIKCNLDGLDLGPQNINLNIKTLGDASETSIRITGNANVTSITPTSGSINGGTKVTIIGNGFSNSSIVSIGGSVCQRLSFSINEMQCLTSSHAAENSILLNIRDGSVTFPNTNVFYSYSDSMTPIISTISPTSEITTNTELTIRGTGFSTDNTNNSVTIGGSICEVTSSTETEIKCTLGLNSAGDYPVILSVDPKGLAANNTIFKYSLIVSTISPTQSGVAGGLTLKINGYGYSNKTKVFICDSECKLDASSSNTQINCIVPKSTNQVTDSNCELVITENNLSYSSNFTYNKSITPELSSVSPLRGGTGGGTLLKITGTNIQAESNADVKVLIAGSECEIISVTSTLIECTTGSYSQSSIKALIEVYVNDVGLAINNNVYFEYVDLWSSRFTWGGNEPPVEGDLVVIDKSQTVYFDSETPILKGIIILGGNLIFDDSQDVHLRAEYIIIAGNGRLQIGTEQKPFEHKAKITMFGSVRSIELPIFGSKVIALREGTIDMHGRPVGVTWTHLGETANSGATQITLKEPVEWESGSEIVIASTGDHLSQGQSEVRRITAVSVDKKTLTLDTALAYTHLSVVRTIGSDGDIRQIEIRAEVGLLTRNVVFQGSNDESWSSLKSAQACPDGFNPGEFAVQTCFLGRYGAEIGTDEFGATIMVHGDSNKQKLRETVFVKLSNVELFHVGQAFRLGRYPIHFHLNYNMPSSYVRECSIHESFNRAVNIHGTNYVTVEKNFIYNILGGAYFLEDGVEIGNIFQYNLAILIKTSSSLLNEDVTPAAFWVTNPNNTYLHNSVAGSSHFGYWYRILDRPDGASYRPDYCPKKIPLGKFFNNTVHGVGRFGLWIFPGYHPSVTGACSDNNPSVAKFEHFTTYSNDKGAEWVMANNLQFRNFISFDHASASIEAKQIIFNEDIHSRYSPTFYNETNGPLISDSIVVGNSDSSKTTSITPYGVVIAWDRGLLVKNVSFYNFPDGSSQAIKPTEIAGRCPFGCGGWTTKFTGLSFKNVMHRTLHRWNWDFIGQDLDGSLSGVVNGYVVSSNNFTSSNPTCVTNTMFKGGAVCRSTDWIRFAYNGLISSIYKDNSNATNLNNSTVSIPYLAKRLTHPKGYMIALEANQWYTFEYTNALYPVNLTYTGTFYNLYPNQYVIIKHKMLRKPDRVTFGDMTSTESFRTLDSNSNKGDWHWNNDTSTLSYIVSNKENRRPYLDVRVVFNAYKCRYVNCEPPVSPALKLPVTKRPNDALFWSNITTWTFSEPGWGGYGVNGNFRLPQDNEDVKIPDGKYVVVDCPLPKIKILQLNGILELDNGLNHKLEADVIFINGGQLIVGWENNPILTNVDIILNGQKDFLNYKLPNQVDSIGGKGIGVYGGLDIHGRPRQKSWTTLQTTAIKGTNKITLKDAVDWEIGESIVITTTSFKVEQTEVVEISEKTSDNKTLTLSSPLLYEHLAYTEILNDSISYSISAGVGLLSRNVKVIGAEYTNQNSDLYGFRIIVSDYSTMGEDGPLYYKGYARLSDVEFIRPGQFSRLSGEEYRYGVLFSNLGNYNYSRPSYIDNCAFRNGYSAAIGILGSASIPIKNNVIYHTIDYGIYLESHSNIIKNNLIVSNRWINSFWPWLESTIETNYMGAIDIQGADSAVIEDNFIAGSERVGLLYKGDVCEGDNFTRNQNHSIKNNIIYSTISAVTILPSHSFILDCVKISGFTIFKSSHWGIYYQNTQTVHVESNILIDNQINIFTQVITPNILDHSMSNKRTYIKNNIIVGQSPSFNCSTDVKSSDSYYTNAGSVVSYTAGPNDRSKVGLTWAQFLSGSNAAPRKPWTNIMTYNSLDGLMIVEGNSFAYFGIQCNGQRDYAISSNKKNDDGQHPMVIKNTNLFSVEHESKIWIHRPNIGKINPADCVDMDCDGLKKNLLTDEDGSFLGRSGTVISQSEFEWGSQQRGLGDFRIPKEALAATNGSMLPINEVYTYRGIVREEDKCVYRTTWQAYECQNIEHKMLLIESMDPDTETRRISPVAIVSDNKYLDLINGPQDHGWCFGYTCQKRVSSFMAIVSSGRNFDIYLSSTPPKQLRFRLVNADSSFKIRLSMHYFASNRIDVYKNERFVLPTNGYYEEGKMKFNVTTNNLNSFMPTVASESGTNLAVRDHRKVYATMSGSDYLDFKTAAAIVLKFGVPAITPEAFFDEKNLVRNFADLLGIDPSRIRKVNIIRESRRKRQASSVRYFELVIFDNPSNQSSFSSDDELSAKSLMELSANVSNLFTTGQLQEMAANILNISLAALTVEKPLSNSTSEIRKLDKIQIIREASNCREQSPCQIQPIVLLLDDKNQPVIGLESSSNPWIIKATLVFKTNQNSEIIFESEVALQNDGFVQFKNLGISDITSSFIIKYELIPPTGIDSSNVRSVNQTAKACTAAILDLVPLDENLIVDEDETFNLTVSIVDKFTQSKIKNISWRNHEWQASARLYVLPKNLTTGILRSASNLVEVDTETSSVKLLDLYLSSSGMYLIEIIIRSKDNEYFLKSLSKAIIVKPVGRTIVLSDAEAPVLYLRFNKDITTDTSNAEIYKATIYNSFVHKYNLTLTRAIYLYDTYMANLGFSLGPSLNGLRSELNNGFVLANGISLTNATLNDEILSVKVVTETVLINVDPNTTAPNSIIKSLAFSIKADLVTLLVGIISISYAIKIALL
ncbi:unnamed protein product [Brachionus calyciflorus]|uniref:Fibrocystin-L n=1 Tax=Brachionus calyciflorus TaxID=104777 RepID=A0A813PKH4_9BILA|nr:unnamed protein product [Brachionus calyciflorus]